MEFAHAKFLPGVPLKHFTCAVHIEDCGGWLSYLSVGALT